MFNSILNLIKLNYVRKNNFFTVKYSKNNFDLLNLLLSINFIKNFYMDGKNINIVLHSSFRRYIKILYTPSNYKYVKYSALKNNYRNNLSSTLVLSTDKGLMTQLDAIKNGLGGVMLFIIF